ncbi:DNA-directed RNA polymerases II, IV and V subunit 9A-like [Hordeum vulgare]|nr:DNA-directed RNA polymerases II, IV and V subunit 9A-like [Hordeum vulgare]
MRHRRKAAALWWNDEKQPRALPVSIQINLVRLEQQPSCTAERRPERRARRLTRWLGVARSGAAPDLMRGRLDLEQHRICVRVWGRLDLGGLGRRQDPRHEAVRPDLMRGRRRLDPRQETGATCGGGSWTSDGRRGSEIAADTCVYKRVLRKSADEPKDTLKDAAADPSLPRTKSVKCYNCGYPEAAYFQAPTKGERGLTLYFICCSPTCGHRVVIGLFSCFSEMEFFTIILEKSSSRQVLPDNFVKMLDGHRPQNMNLRQDDNVLRKLWDVEVVFDADGSMYLDRGWKQFVRAYDPRHGYFLVFRYDDNATFAVKVFDTTMCRRRYQDDDDAKMEFFTIILEKSSSRQVLPDNFVKMLDGHRPQNMKLRQGGNGLRKLWDVEVVFDTDGSMYLDRGWKQFVRAYDLRHGYFLVFRYDDNATFTVKVFDTTMCRRRYQDDDDASNGSRSSEYCDMCYVYGNNDSGYNKSSSDFGYSKSSSDDGLTMVIPQLGDRAMPIVVEDYTPQPGLGLRHSKRIRMMKEKVKKEE